MLKNILKAALFSIAPERTESGAPRWGLPVILWGPPGVGKTHEVRAIARAYGLEMERLSPGERGEGQFGVVPVPHQDGYLHYPPPQWAKKFDNSPGVLFIDEINTAPPALQAPLLGLVQLRVLGGHEFGPRIRTLAAANEVSDAAGGWDIAPALCNRFCHIRADGLDPSAWSEALLSGFSGDNDAPPMDARAEEARVEAAWPAALAYARGLVSGFVTRRPELLQKPPTPGSTDRAWPSRRSVEYVSCALAGARVHGLAESETDDFLGGFVGLPWVVEFRLWVRDADLPDPAELLDGATTYTHDPRRLDRSLAVAGACAALVASPTAPRRRERAAAAWRLFGEIHSDAPDIVIPACRVVASSGLGFPAVPEAKTLLAKMQPYLSAAGIVP